MNPTPVAGSHSQPFNAGVDYNCFYKPLVGSKIMLEKKYIRHSILAENFIKLKEYHKAIAQYQLALRYRPSEIMLYINLGKLLFLSGQAKLALDILYRGSLISLKAGKLTKAQTILDLMTHIDQQHRLTSLVSNDVRTLSQINSNTQ